MHILDRKEMKDYDQIYLLQFITIVLPSALFPPLQHLFVCDQRLVVDLLPDEVVIVVVDELDVRELVQTQVVVLSGQQQSTYDIVDQRRVQHTHLINIMFVLCIIYLQCGCLHIILIENVCCEVDIHKVVNVDEVCVFVEVLALHVSAY